MIDTGLGVANIKEAVQKLTQLPILVVTTHVHWDHIGGHKYFERIAVYEKEGQWLSGKFPIPLQMVKESLLGRPCDFPEEFDWGTYQIYQGGATQILQDGEIICLGNRKIKVIHTPGHSPGHCCFFEEERGYLYAGDLIYQGCLDAFYPTTNPRQFWMSVKRVALLPVKKVFPGHHTLQIPESAIRRIESAFAEIENAGKLEQGAGIFDFGAFQIHI